MHQVAPMFEKYLLSFCRAGTSQREAALHTPLLYSDHVKKNLHMYELLQCCMKGLQNLYHHVSPVHFLDLHMVNVPRAQS